MCGIAGFSKPANSRTNARHLAHHLLTQIESRGSHASGFAYIGSDGGMGVYKNPYPGSQLSLHDLPRDARAVVLHTRYATQGDRRDNRNNHPVLSTDNRIALVHNGVISNDYALRGGLGIKEGHGAVDSLVIPSIIAQHGVEGLSELSGYAAIAWLDSEDGETLSIARLKSSPVAYTSIYDGTFVFASTQPLLEMALLDAGFGYGGVFEMAEGKMMRITEGFIDTHEKAPSMSYDYGAYRRHSTATSGGKKVTTDPDEIRAPKQTKVVGSEVALFSDGSATPAEERSCETDIQGYYEDLEEWRRAQEERDQRIASRAMAMMSGPADHWSDADWDEYMEELEAREEMWRNAASEESFKPYGEGFYIVDNEGDITHHPTLDDLESRLAWLAKMSRTEYDMFDVSDEIYWVNFIMDLGAVDDDGNLISWVDDSAEIDDFESPAVRNLQYIREGAQKLATLKGA